MLTMEAKYKHENMVSVDHTAENSRHDYVLQQYEAYFLFPTMAFTARETEEWRELDCWLSFSVKGHT
jgi:hypothetical protein